MSHGVGKKTVDERKPFYPGADYVDISGIDIYGVDYQGTDPKYREYFDAMSEVSPGKMLASGEGDAIPDPDLTASGELPRWSWVLPWWGAPSGRRPAGWATRAMRHEHVVTLDELPPFGSGNIAPHLGILEPRDDGSAWFTDQAPGIEAFAVDRDGSIKQDKGSWTEVAAVNDRPYQPWKAFDRLQFPATKTRHPMPARPGRPSVSCVVTLPTSRSAGRRSRPPSPRVPPAVSP